MTIGAANTDPDEWGSMSVASEVIRGYRLREEKPKYKSRHYPKIIDLKRSYYQHKQSRKSRRTLDNTGPCCCNLCNHWSSVPNLKLLKKCRNYKKKSKVRCPLRIAELAAPTKRHCIDTWRNKSYILPDFMIYRLKQHVMDQRPIAHIPDAIRCFQMRKRNRKKSNKSTKNKLGLQLPSKRKADLQNLCLLFAIKIMPKLVTPLNITMNSDFEKLYQVVSQEISAVTKFKKCLDTRCGNNYRQIHADVTNKVTLWMMNILDDAAHNILEENLKDFEAEVGPPVDFLEDVVDTVLDICLPRPPIESSEEESDSYTPRSERSKEELYSGESQTMIEETDTENAIESPKDISDKLNEYTDTENEADSQQSITDELKEYTYKEFFENEILDIINQLSTDSEYFENAINDIINNISNEIESSDETPDINDTEDIDKGNLENIEAPTTPTVIDNSDKADVPIVENEASLIKSDSEIRRNIVFAEPNEHVLSDADELWPSDTFSPRTLKPSASVTRSIISLGKLSEDDEKLLSQMPGTDAKNKRSDTEFQNKEDVFKLSDSTDVENEKSETEHQNNELDVPMLPDTIVNKKEHAQQDETPIEGNNTSTEKLNTAIIEDGNTTELAADGESAKEVINNSNMILDKDINADEKVKDMVLGPVQKILSDEQLVVDPAVGDEQTVKTELHDVSAIQSKNVSDQKLTDPIVKLPEEDPKFPIKQLDSKDKFITSDTYPIVELSHEEPKVKDLGNKDKLLTSNVEKVVKSKELVDAVLPAIKSDVKLSKSTEVKHIILDELSELHDKKVAEFIVELIKILKSNEKQTLSTKDDVITAKLINLLNLGLSDEKLTKAIASLVRKYLSELQGISKTKHTRNTKSQTDATRPSHLKTAKIPSTNINSKSKMDKDLDKNKRVAEKPKPKSNLPVIKKKTKNKGIATDEQIDEIKVQPEKVIETQENIVTLNENEIRAWCKDLDNGFKNLEIWKDWLQNACIQTYTLIKNKRRDCLYSKEKHVRNWIKLHRDIKQDVTLWNKLNQHTHEKFEDFRKYYSDNEIKLSKFKSSCSCVNKGRKTRK